MDRADDLIDYFKLDTKIFPDYIRHVVRKSDSRKSQDWEMEEIWTCKRLLGKGGSGTVWLQETRETTHKLRAVKELVKKDARVDFKRELLAIAKFSKYIDLFAKFFGWYESAESIFIAMEYFKLGDLGSCLNVSLPEIDAKRIAHQLLNGVSIMHEAGFAHRDLKPQNVFVVSTSPVWLVRIGDFGISKRNYNNETDYRTRIFTPAYSAPELLYYVNEDIESDAYNNAVDLWSLGCLIFNVLTQTVPFPDLKPLKDFCQAKLAFPSAKLEACHVSPTGIEFLQNLLAPVPSQRPTAIKALKAVWLSEASTVVRATIAHPASSHAVSNHSIECRDHAFIIDREENRFSDLYDRLSLIGTRGSFQSSHEFNADPKDRGISSGRLESTFTRELTHEYPKCTIIEPQYTVVSGKPRKANKHQSNIQEANVNSENPDSPKQLEIEAEHRDEKTHNRLSSKTNTTDRDSNLMENESINRTSFEVQSTDNISAHDKKYLISLFKAATKDDDLERVRLAISDPPRVHIINIQDEKGQTPLHWAVEADPQARYSIAKLLLNYGADTSIKDNRGRTAFLLAAKSGYDEMLKLLLEHRAVLNVINLADEKGQTALTLAVKYGHAGIVHDLLLVGADIYAKDLEGRTPLLNAVRLGYQYYPVTGTGHKYHRVINYNGRTARLDKIVQLLLEHGSNVHTHSKQSETPLHLAVQYESPVIARSLIGKGADVNHIPQCGICGYSADDTPLKRAVTKSSDRNVKLLLRHGALVPDEWTFRMKVRISTLGKATKQELFLAREKQKVQAIHNRSSITRSSMSERVTDQPPLTQSQPA